MGMCMVGLVEDQYWWSHGREAASKMLYHDNSARIRQFNIGDKVYVQNFGQGQRWQPGQIQEVTGSVPFLIELVAPSDNTRTT